MPSPPARASVTPTAEDVMPSWQARCFRVAIRVLMRRLTWGDDRALARRARRVFGAPGPLQWLRTRAVRIEPVRNGRIRGEWIRAAGSAHGVILYFHAGGYVAGSPASDRPITAGLARLAGRRVSSGDHPGVRPHLSRRRVAAGPLRVARLRRSRRAAAHPVAGVVERAAPRRRAPCARHDRTGGRHQPARDLRRPVSRLADARRLHAGSAGRPAAGGGVHERLRGGRAVSALALIALLAAGDVAVTFVDPTVQPPPGLSREARDAGSEPDPDASGGSSNIRFRIVRDLSDRGPLGAMVAGRLSALEVTWSDATLFRSRAETEAFLRRLLASPRGSTLTHVPWAQALSVPSVVATVRHVEGEAGVWQV